jgi:DNA helicase-2/ATP-dependent DNA helicase PcrA
MLRRVDALVGGGAAGRVWGGTFHAVATRLLRIHGEAVGLAPGFTIHDRADSEDLLDVVRAELALCSTERRFPRKATCLEIYSRCVNAREPLASALAAGWPWCRPFADDLKRLFRAYVDRKAEQAILDYDDLLLFLHALCADAAAGEAVRRRFDRVLVDEYQDTNLLQAEILALLRPGGAGLTVVGDDAQSIYSFRAATVRNILDFPRQYDGTIVITLEESYRSTPALLAATNAIIAGAAERHEKRLWSRRPAGERPSLVTCQDEDEQTDWVVAKVLELREAGVPLRRQAVLFRASHHSLSLELALARRAIPFHKYGGLKFVEAAHVKDALAFLRLAENPRDVVAGTRLLLLLPGVGPRRARQLMEASDAGFAAWAALRPPSPLFAELVALLQELSAPSPPRACDVGEQLRRVRGFYAPLCERRYDNAAARLRDLEQLEQVAARQPDRRSFLEELTLDPPASTQELAGAPLLDEDWLVLSTIHSAKGLEWDAVFVIHASDGNIPSDLATGHAEEIEEERRLFYVAASRARDQLHVCFPLRYYTRPGGRSDRHTYAQPSRFLDGEVRGRFDERPARARPALETATPAATGVVADVRARIRAIWS